MNLSMYNLIESLWNEGEPVTEYGPVTADICRISRTTGNILCKHPNGKEYFDLTMLMGFARNDKGETDGDGYSTISHMVASLTYTAMGSSGDEARHNVIVAHVMALVATQDMFRKDIRNYGR